MGEREFLIYLDAEHENRYRHRHLWDRGAINELVLSSKVE